MLSAMARIRIVDSWLRSPISAEVRRRAILVVAETWAEQRVLMRAYAESEDQTRPTIVLHGTQLAIGPASLDPHGSWGIHVNPPDDGRAQALREQLELAARRLYGSKGNPPRLEDEAPAFERKRTNNWAPGTPRDLPGGGQQHYYEPTASPPFAASVIPRAPASASDARTVALQVGGAQPVQTDPNAIAGAYAQAQVYTQGGPPPPAPSPGHASAGSYPNAGPPPAQPPYTSAAAPAPAAMAPGPPPPAPDPSPRRRNPPPTTPPGAFAASASSSAHAQGWTSPVSPRPAPQVEGRRTILGFAGGVQAPARAAPRPVTESPSMRFASVVGRTMPVGFQLTDAERVVLDTLGDSERLTAPQIAEIAGVADGAAWMAQLMAKLTSFGLDIVAPGDEVDGAPSYLLRH
jgi:hypothetical protein